MLNESLLQAAVSNSRDGITISDNTKPDNPLIWVNESFERMTGYSSQEIIGRNCRFLQANDTTQPAIKTLQNAVKTCQPCLVTLRNYRKSGTLFWNEVSLSPIRDSAGRVTHFLGIQKDVTAQVILNQTLQDENLRLKSSNEMLEYLIHIDAPTGLHNRRYLEEQLSIQWKIGLRQKCSLSVFMIDIDYFKNFNDIYGHVVGDQAIKAVGRELNSSFLRGTDFVARYGGEEFMILAVGMDEVQASDYSSIIVEKVRALQIPHRGSPIGVITISLGYAQVVPFTAMKPSELLEQADNALYRAKRLGKNIAVNFRSDADAGINLHANL